MTAVVVDDEPLARARLQRLLEAQGVHVAGEGSDAREAVALAADAAPDLLFLDIQMPGLTGMQLAAALSQIDSPPLLVFVTGYAEHAIAAFEHGALDYLVKPVTEERLAATLVRATERLAERTARRAVREEADRPAAADPAIQRVPVRGDYAVRLVPVDDILAALSRQRRVFIQTADEELQTTHTLRQLDQMLPKDRFLRIHDSCLVNLLAVRELLFLGDHSYEVRLSNGRLHPVARSRYGELQRRLGLGRDSAS